MSDVAEVPQAAVSGCSNSALHGCYFWRELHRAARPSERSAMKCAPVLSIPLVGGAEADAGKYYNEYHVQMCTLDRESKFKAAPQTMLAAG